MEGLEERSPPGHLGFDMKHPPPPEILEEVLALFDGNLMVNLNTLFRVN